MGESSGDRDDVTSLPDPLREADIEGQNPHTPERLPGHTKFYSRDALRPTQDGAFTLLAIVLGIAALLTLIAILAAS